MNRSSTSRGGSPAAFLGLSPRRYDRGYRQTPHTHDYDGITLVLRGSLTEGVAGRLETATALSVVFKPAGVVHELLVGDEGVSTLQVRLAPGTLARVIPSIAPADRVSIVPAGWKWTHAGPAAAEVLQGAAAPDAPLRTRMRSDRKERRLAVARLMHVFAQACAEERVRGGHEASEPPVWLAQVRATLDGPSSGTRLAAAARAARVHPVYLARMIRKHYGCSIGELAKRARLRLTERLLGDPHSSLADVAGEAGFADQAHLCREFRFATGVTPLAYRRLALDA